MSVRVVDDTNKLASLLGLLTLDDLKLLITSSSTENEALQELMIKKATKVIENNKTKQLNNNINSNNENNSDISHIENNNRSNNTEICNGHNHTTEDNIEQIAESEDYYGYNSKHGNDDNTPHNKEDHVGVSSGGGSGSSSGNGSAGSYSQALPAKADLAYYAYYYKSDAAVEKKKFLDGASEKAETQQRRPPAYHWNEQFQDISEKIHDDDLYNEEVVYEKMAHLYQDFVYVVETYGRVIITERFLPLGQRSIPPAYYMGGQAGGEKYIVQGILFKFAVDKHGLYGGDHYAAKAAGHDLKSLVQCYKSRIPGLHVPMMCLVDYLGYRLIALSLVPIDRSTLCYGSCDGGQVVFNGNLELCDKMRALGQSLNLKEHPAGSGGKLIVGPCDIEGHKGKDNRFYLLDFARLFPPQAPMGLPKHPNEYLYKLLRPELVKNFDVPLSSDAFTLFGKRDADVHNAEVLRATEYLYDVVIPDFAKTLDFHSEQNAPDHHETDLHRVATNKAMNCSEARCSTCSIAVVPSTNASATTELYETSSSIAPSSSPGTSSSSSSSSCPASFTSPPSSPNASSPSSRPILRPVLGHVSSRLLDKRSSSSSSSSAENTGNCPSGVLHTSNSTDTSVVAESTTCTTSAEGSGSVDRVRLSSGSGFIRSLNSMRMIRRRSSYSILSSSGDGGTKNSQRITEEKLAELIHREGINMRHLGRIRASVSSPQWRNILLVEILGRVIKNTIRQKQRQMMEQLRIPAVVPYKEVAISYLNLVFGNTQQSFDYWNTELINVAEDLFEESLSHERAAGSVSNLKERIDPLALFRAVKRLVGMVFSPHCISEDFHFSGPEPFQATDLLHIPPKIKEMRIAMYASATSLYLKAKYMTDTKERERLVNIASLQFTSALRTSPDDHMILCNYALLLRLQLRYTEAMAYYKMAIRHCPTSARIQGHYAWFLHVDMKLYGKAEKYYKRALAVDSSHVRTLSDYGMFLYRVKKDYITAEECFKKCVVHGYKQAIINYSIFLEHMGKHHEAKYYKEKARSGKGTMIVNGKVNFHEIT